MHAGSMCRIVRGYMTKKTRVVCLIIQSRIEAVLRWRVGLLERRRKRDFHRDVHGAGDGCVLRNDDAGIVLRAYYKMFCT